MTSLLLLVAACSLIGSTAAYDNGMAKKPPMGWQTWCSVGPCGEDHCNDGQIREMADTLVKKDPATGVSMQELGYNWIVLDDCWHPHRASNGSLVPFPRFFPHGMKPVIDYVHSLGLTFGLYTSVGDETCHGGWSPGSYNHWKTDADTFASWGVDYVKIDYCGGHDSPTGHHAMSAAMNATGRHMVLALCRGPYQQDEKWGYAPEVAQVWRATGDHHDEFSSTMKQVDSVKGRSSWSGPHNWAYLDMMMTGGQGCKSQCVGSKDDTGICNFTTPQHCPGQTDAEYRTEASLYAVVSSPMMVGTDIRLMTPIMKELLLNKEAIAINQDYLAPPGDAVPACKKTTDGEAAGSDMGEVWVRKLTDGSMAVAMPNLGNVTASLSVCLDAIGWKGGAAPKVRDVWQKKDLGAISGGKYTATVKAHDTLLLKISS